MYFLCHPFQLQSQPPSLTALKSINLLPPYIVPGFLVTHTITTEKKYFLFGTFQLHSQPLPPNDLYCAQCSSDILSPPKNILLLSPIRVTAGGVLQVQHATCTHTPHSSRPTPYYPKDTIHCICKEIVTSIAPEDGCISPNPVELKEHKLILNCINFVNYFLFNSVCSLQENE
jgi:hypothetical protein